MIAAIYCRVSSEEQRERQTINNQREFAERYCALHEIPLHDFYLDDGVSGTIALELRPEGSRLIADAEAKAFDTVLVYKLDRLGRNPRLILNSVGDLEAAGVQIRSMTEAFDTSSPSGRFMLTMLAGVAGLERDTIVERSMEGTKRLARAGAWLGGIVPYGYRVEGKSKDARLVISEEPLPGIEMTEADVVRLIFRQLADDRKSCPEITDHLNNLGVPTAYVRDGRKLSRGKRKQATAGIWRPGRVRSLVVNATYKGVHQYGKRSKRGTEPIEQPVPAIIDAETWERAQRTLSDHFIIARNPNNRQYLLRGLIKCGVCGLTYCGTGWRSAGNEIRTYYACNGRQQYRGLYGSKGQRCPSKAINSSIEDRVWEDIVGFGRDPGAVLEQLAQAQEGKAVEGDHLAGEIKRLNQAIQAKGAERDQVITWCRRGRISEADMDRQLDQIQLEEAGLKKELERLSELARSAETASAQLKTAEQLLLDLNQKLDQPLTWELKRQLVEMLVEEILVETVESDGKKEAITRISYRFGPPESREVTLAENHTGMDSGRPRA